MNESITLTLLRYYYTPRLTNNTQENNTQNNKLATNSFVSQFFFKNKANHYHNNNNNNNNNKTKTNMVIMHSTHSSTVTTGSIAGCVTTNNTTTTNSSLSKSKSQSSQPLNNSISISNNNIKLLSSTMIMMNSSSSSSKKRQRQRQCVSVISHTQKDNIINILKTIHPTDYIKAAFKANGYNRCNNNDNNDNNFDFDFDDVTKRCISRFKHTKPTKDMLYAYNSTDIALAVRTNNVILARQLYNNGNGNGVYNGTNACNRFGESILHIACRRGNINMIKFLINEVGLRLDTDTIRDDYNRTPLHDAFWTTSADINNSSSYDVIDFLLTSQPNVVELLLLKDIRGYTPLDYARSEHRTKWLHFLWKRKNILRVSSSSSSSTTTTTPTTTTDDIIDSIDSIKEQQSQQSQQQQQSQSQSQPQNKRQRLSQ